MSITSPQRGVSRAACTVVLAALGVLFVLPVTWIVVASVDRSATLALRWPSQPSTENFRDVLDRDIALLPLWNSVVLSVGTGALTLLVAVLAAYPLSRYQSRFGKSFLYTVLFGASLPITAMMVPVYSLFIAVGLIDSMAGTVLFMTASSLPMAIWMVKNFFDGVPISLEEAAWVDGAGALRALAAIVVPLVRPGLAVVFIFVFVGAWGNFFVPFVLLLSPDQQPAAVSIYSFFGDHGAVAYGQLAAYSLIYSAPVLGLYVVVSRVLGGTAALAGAVKG